MISTRSKVDGNDTKKVASKRPALINSGGNLTQVATYKMEA